MDTGLDFGVIQRALDRPDGIGLLAHTETLDDPERIAHAHAVINRHEMEGAARATWIDGVEQLLKDLRQSMVPIPVVTRNNR